MFIFIGKALNPLGSLCLYFLKKHLTLEVLMFIFLDKTLNTQGSLCLYFLIKHSTLKVPYVYISW